MKTKVENLTGNAGNPVTNQFQITTNKGTFFQSYESIIVFIPKKWDAKTQLDKYYWNYSTTTGKYRNIFLGEDRKETERKIKNGTYLLRNLNK